MARLHTAPPSRSVYGGTSVHPPPKSSRVGARATMARVTGVPLRRVVVHDAPASVDATHEQRRRTARGDGIAPAYTARQRVLADQVRDVGRDRIDVEDREREGVAHHLAGEEAGIRGTNRRRTAHQPAAADVRRRIARQIVVDEGIEVAAIPVHRGACEHGFELGANSGALRGRGVIGARRTRARRGEHQTADDDPCRSRRHAPTSSSWPLAWSSWRATSAPPSRQPWRTIPSRTASTQNLCSAPSLRPWPAPWRRSWRALLPRALLAPLPRASAGRPSRRGQGRELVEGAAWESA